MVHPIAFVRSRFRREFTMRRWGTNPHQMYNICIMLAYSVLQVAFGTSGILKTSEIDLKSTYFIAGTNIIGGIVAVYGLHVREFDRSIKVEAYGYVSLIVVMMIYCALLISNNPFPYTAYALGFGEAFVLASIHRTIQILRYFRAKKSGDTLAIWAMLGRLEKDGQMP